MKLVFVTEARFTKDAKNNVYGGTSFNLELWKRYLTCFSKVVVMARVNYDENHIGNHSYLSSGENVSFIELPLYIGPLEYLKKRSQVLAKIKNSIDNIDGVFICRVPGTIGGIAIKHLYKRKRPFGVEVVGDPWDVFAPGGVKHFFRSYFRWIGYFNLKKNVARASAVLYVTEKKLQQRYPANSDAFQTFASNVKIINSFLRSQPSKHVFKKEYTIISVGSLEQMYKAPDVVLKALNILKNQRINCNLIWLGDGVFKEIMQGLAKELGIANLVDFKGNVNSKDVREYLIDSDVFVLVSKTEGLPRAVIEAMAVGLPCVGSKVGGIPELLEESVLVQKSNPVQLANTLKKIFTNPSFYNDQASRNLLESEKYLESVLNEKRQVFYNYLKEL